MAIEKTVRAHPEIGALELPRRGGTRRKHVRWWRLAALSALLLVALAVVGSFFVDEPLRRNMERQLNAQLTGYQARLAKLSFHPLGFSITLTDLTIAQTAHPDPPVANFPTLKASVHWRALLHARLVADFELDRPAIHVDLRNLQAEVADDVDLKDKGWQQALEAIYPLKINYFTVNNGRLAYIEGDGTQALQLSQVNVVAANVRNVQSPERTYPSSIHLDGRVFESGRLLIDGHADFLATPYVGVDADVRLQHVELKHLKPVARHANLYVSGGVLDANGHVEYAPKVKEIHLAQAIIKGIAIDYVHSAATDAAERKRLAAAQDMAEKELKGDERTILTVDQLAFEDASVGFVNEASEPQFRVFLSQAKLEMSGFSNRKTTDTTNASVKGYLMGSGASSLHVSTQLAAPTTELDLWLQIDNAPLPKLNDVLRAYGGFDVTAGELEFYGELHSHAGQMSGYVKPLLSDLRVYDRRQDADKSLPSRLYEIVVGGAANLLENRAGHVGARAGVSGSVSDPNVSLWEFALGLIRNAIFTSVLPGFEEAVRNPPPEE